MIVVVFFWFASLDGIDQTLWMAIFIEHTVPSCAEEIVARIRIWNVNKMKLVHAYSRARAHERLSEQENVNERDRETDRPNPPLWRLKHRNTSMTWSVHNCRQDGSWIDLYAYVML